MEERHCATGSEQVGRSGYVVVERVEEASARAYEVRAAKVREALPLRAELKGHLMDTVTD